MLHPTVWLDTPLDVLLNIAKWLSTKRILAFSRTCRYFASTILDTDWTHKSIESKPKTRSSIWKLARECQYPDKPAWAFLSDCEQYMVAARRKFILMIHEDNYSNTIYEYDSKSYAMMGDIEDIGLFDTYCSRLVFKTKNQLKRHLLVSSDIDFVSYKIVGSYDSKEEVENNIPDKIGRHDTISFIADLSVISIWCNNQKQSNMWGYSGASFYKNGILMDG
jgi:hypothetical protein